MVKSIVVTTGVIVTMFLNMAMAQSAEESPIDCSNMAHPQIIVNLHEVPVKYDVTRTIEELSAMDIDTVSPFPDHFHTHIGGVMSGNLVLDHRMGFHETPPDQNGDSCLALTYVKIDIAIEPKIYIANQYHQDSCWFKEIFAHEAKHVEVDRAVIRKYKEQITDSLNMLLWQPADYTVSTAGDDDTIYKRDKIQLGLENAIQVMFNKMMRDRQEQQQKVDNIQEYSNITRACISSS